MKKTIITFVVALISVCAFAQKIGVKLPAPQTFTISSTVTADSIAVARVTDDGKIISATVWFLKAGAKSAYLPTQTLSLVLWEGTTYTKNKKWTNATVIARIKVLLNIK